MSADIYSSWSYAEALPEEDEVLLRARERGYELGVSPVGTGAAALLTTLAACSGARTVVEIGSGVGVSGVSILRGLAQQSVMTTIDIDLDHLDAAREAFADAGFKQNRTRTISGRAQDVLPRLTDAAYDLIFIDADKANLPLYVEQGARLLRRGGTLIVNDALDQHRVPQPADRRPSTTATRKATRYLREREDFVTATVPTGSGLLMAVKVA